MIERLRALLMCGAAKKDLLNLFALCDEDIRALEGVALGYRCHGFSEWWVIDDVEALARWLEENGRPLALASELRAAAGVLALEAV